MLVDGKDDGCKDTKKGDVFYRTKENMQLVNFDVGLFVHFGSCCLYLLLDSRTHSHSGFRRGRRLGRKVQHYDHLMPLLHCFTASLLHRRNSLLCPSLSM